MPACAPPIQYIIRGRDTLSTCVTTGWILDKLMCEFNHSNVALTRFEADKDIMDALVSLRKKPGASERMASDPAPATSLWGMLYADDATVLSQSPEQLRTMMVMIVTVCAVFGLTVSEAKTEIMCLRMRGNTRYRHHIQR